MKVLVLGGTGPTGDLIISGALRAGHSVVVLVRDPARLLSSHVKVVVGDATNLTDMRVALAGCDALVSALGSGGVNKSTIASRSARCFLRAARETELRRLVVLSAFGVGGSFVHASPIQKLAFSTTWRGLYADKAAADAAIRESALDWTLVYPMMMRDGVPSTLHAAAETAQPNGMPQVSRTFVADFMVSCLTSSEWVKRTAILS